MQVYRCTGIQPYRYTGIQVYRYVQYLYTGTPGWHTCITSTYTHLYTCTVAAYCESRAHACRCTGVQVYSHTGTGVQVCTIPVYRYTRLAYLYTGTPGSRCLLLLAGYRWCCCCRCAAAAIQRCTCALSCRHGENSHAGNSFATVVSHIPLVHLYTCITVAAYLYPCQEINSQSGCGV